MDLQEHVDQALSLHAGAREHLLQNTSASRHRLRTTCDEAQRSAVVLEPAQVILGRRANNLENSLDLIHEVPTLEQGRTKQHLAEDAAQ
jgi:hypothetical protein